MMKRKILMLTMMLIFALTACGKSEAPVEVAEESAETETIEETVVELSEDTETAEESLPANWITGGSSKEEAQELEQNIWYQGKYTDGEVWVSFTTGDKENATYYVSLVNCSVGSNAIEGYVIDQDDSEHQPTEDNNKNCGTICSIAKQDGTANTGKFADLEPNTTYYIRLSCKDAVDYSLIVGDVDDNLEEAPAEPVRDEDFIPGTNQASAWTVPLNTKLSGQNAAGYMWFSFTTTDKKDAEYYVTVVNRTENSNPIEGYVVDRYGFEHQPTDDNNKNSGTICSIAKQDGTANTGKFADLEPNTTYYIRLSCKDAVDYSLTVYAPDQVFDGYKTSTNLAEVQGTIGEDEKFFTGTNQDDATLLAHNVTYDGHIEACYAWMGFTTGELEGAEYTVTVKNLTPGSDPIEGYVIDKYGFEQMPAEDDSNHFGTLCNYAEQDGKERKGMFDNLKPNTTYYIRLHCDSQADYQITIGVKDQNKNEEEKVFDVPFEMNDTYIQFKAESSEFLNREKALENLKPVAEIILAHPGCKILLAGTTATDGSQEARVILSESRAEAVKSVLVETYRVPEEQLITRGLGFDPKVDIFPRGRDRDANGNFVETEGAKNRRVVVLDADSETGKQILGK